MSPVPRYVFTADADPKRIYHNVLVSIDETRHLNNGQPSALAAWLDALDIQEGEQVIHVGAGVGYYSAIIAEVVGPRGKVVAIEVDEALAARARANLARWNTVDVIAQDGSKYDPGPVDVIFVNAGVTHPSGLWLDRVKPGGRLPKRPGSECATGQANELGKIFSMQSLRRDLHEPDYTCLVHTKNSCLSSKAI